MESPHEVLDAALKGSGHSPAMQAIYRERFGLAMLSWAVEMANDLREEMGDSSGGVGDIGSRKVAEWLAAKARGERSVL